MSPESQLAKLLELAENLQIEVRHVSTVAFEGDSAADIVKLRGKEILFVNPHAAIADRVSAIAQALSNRPELKEMFLPPTIRDLFESEEGTW